MRIPRRPSFTSRLALGTALSLFAPLCTRPVLSAASAVETKPAEYVVAVETERPEAIYRQGEKVIFNIRVLHHQQPAAEGLVSWTVSKDGVPPIQKGEAQLHNGQAAIEGKLNEPGFLHCEVTFQHDEEKSIALAAAGIDIGEIQPSLPAPAGFRLLLG